jgi:hypothetical protein
MKDSSIAMRPSPSRIVRYTPKLFTKRTWCKQTKGETEILLYVSFNSQQHCHKTICDSAEIKSLVQFFLTSIAADLLFIRLVCLHYAMELLLWAFPCRKLCIAVSDTVFVIRHICWGTTIFLLQNSFKIPPSPPLFHKIINSVMSSLFLFHILSFSMPFICAPHRHSIPLSNNGRKHFKYPSVT